MVGGPCDMCHTESREDLLAQTVERTRELRSAGEQRRATKTLSLSYRLGRKKYGQLTPCHPSPFLQELPTDLVENAAEKSKQPVTVDKSKQLFDAMKMAVEAVDPGEEDVLSRRGG